MKPITFFLSAALLTSATSCSAPPDAEGESSSEVIRKPPRSVCDSIDQRRAKDPWLGAAIGSETVDTGDTSIFRRYANGTIILPPRTGCAVAMRSAMWDRWHTTLRATIGYPGTDVVNVSASHQWQLFDAGAMFTSPAGTFFLTGAVEMTELALDAGSGTIYPTADVISQRNGLSAPLEDGSWLAWTPVAGVHRVSGAIAQTWSASGDARGLLGFPIDDETCVSGVCTQDFQWGTLQGAPGSIRRQPSTLAQGDAAVVPGDDGATFAPAPASCDATIDAHYAKTSAVLGPAVDLSENPLVGGGSFRRYQNGVIVLNPNVGCAFFLVNGFRDVSGFGPSVAAPQVTADLGFPVSDELWNDAGRAHQYFDKGSLFWTSTLGVRKLTGPLALRQWSQRLSVGYPSIDQTTTANDGYNPPRDVVEFENDAMFAGTSEAHAGILDGLRARPSLGLPSWVDATSCDDAGVCWKSFDHGAVRWTFPNAPETFDEEPYFNLHYYSWAPDDGPYFDDVAGASATGHSTPAGRVYTTTFGDAPPTLSSPEQIVLRGLLVPSDASTEPLRFLRHGWGAEGCGVPAATVTFAPGQESTPGDLISLFGMPYPPPGTTIAICAPSDFPDSIPLEVFFTRNEGYRR